MFSSNSRPLPPRTHSINAVKHANYFASVDEELRDCKRVQRQGQEEDLREALSRMMVRVEEMYETLQSSHQTTTDLETQLTLSESNLKLALANNEMLEDALKSGSLSKDVGWRRSVPSPVVVAPLPASHSQQMSTAIDENENDAQGGDGGGILPDSSDSPSSDHDSRAASPAPAIASQTPNNDSRFFRFRFTGSGRSTPTLPPNSPPLTRASRPGRTSSHPAVGHLTSASLPSLVGSPPLPTAPAPPVVNNELEELREQLLVEKRKSEKITREKSQLEAELENLSQALFEEANKMVKVERIKRAEAEDELKDVHAEKDALKSALRLIEEDRMRVENIHRPHVNGIDGSRTNHSRTSSQDAIVSPRPRDSLTPPPSSPPPPLLPPPFPPPQSTSAEVVISAEEQDPAVEDAPPSPAPLYVPPPHVEDSAPASRTGSPMPLPHPHRLSHLRTGPAPPPAPAPPPPSAADGFPISPWADPPLGEDDEYGTNVDVDADVDASLSIPPIVTLYSPPGEAEMGVPWGKW